MNKTRGEFEAVIAGKTYVVKPTLDLLERFEGEFGAVSAMMLKIENLEVSTTDAIKLNLILADDPDLTKEMVYSSVVEKGNVTDLFLNITNYLVIGLNEVLESAPVEESGEEDQGKPQAEVQK